MSVDPRPSSEDAPRKAVLFCPECGHESAATGDWIVEPLDGRSVYSCPECGAEIATRGRAPQRCRA